MTHDLPDQVMTPLAPTVSAFLRPRASLLPLCNR